MLTITEKDGATIITIENPSASEQDIIKKAKKRPACFSVGKWSEQGTACKSFNAFDNFCTSC